MQRAADMIHSATVSLRCFLCLVLWASVSSTAQPSKQIWVQLDDVNLSDGRVHFRPSNCDLQAPPAAQDLQQMARADTPTYVLLVNVNKTSAFFGSFIYEFYVGHRSAAQGAQICVIRVQATPSGTFVDQMSDVGFHIGESPQHSEDGTVAIPLHNSSYKQPILQAQPPTPFATVSLSGKYPIPIKISNLLSSLPVAINGISATPSNPGDWQVPPQAALHLTRTGVVALEPGQTLDTGIEVTLVPNRWHALGASIFPLAPDKAQETVHMSVDFNTPGGIPGSLEIALPVRFKPSFWNLALAVFVGAGLGSVLALLLAQKSTISAYKAVAIALGLGILAEALGIVLVNGNSEFRLLGFELDPYQLLPASLIGALIGLMGFRKAEDFLALFKRKAP